VRLQDTFRPFLLDSAKHHLEKLKLSKQYDENQYVVGNGGTVSTRFFESSPARSPDLVMRNDSIASATVFATLLLRKDCGMIIICECPDKMTTTNQKLGIKFESAREDTCE